MNKVDLTGYEEFKIVAQKVEEIDFLEKEQVRLTRKAKRDAATTRKEIGNPTILEVNHEFQERKRFTGAVANLESSWNNLEIRNHLASKGLLNERTKREYPVSRTFNDWAKENWGLIEKDLNADDNDSVNYILNDRLNKSYFPVSDKYKDHMLVQTGEIKTLISLADERIKRWNPRVMTTSPIPETDEFGDEIIDTISPQIIGDIENPQFAGINEYGENEYNDFDTDGHFLPMGNPNNSTDYQDDFDPLSYRPEDWNSVDGINDHHLEEYFYKEVGVTENPIFSKDGSTQWVTEREDNLQPYIAPEPSSWQSVKHGEELPKSERLNNEVFMEDAQNWMQRTSLIAETENADTIQKIVEAYPVSKDFLDYIQENEITWDVVKERISTYLNIRKVEFNIATRQKPTHIEAIEKRIKERQ